MKELKLKKHVIEVYESIDELPVIRFHKFNKFMLIDAHVGATTTDVDKHLEKIVLLINKKKYDDANVELQNMRQNIAFCFANINPACLAFATFVNKIDGKICDDLTDSGLQKIVDIISDVAISDIKNEVAAQKKNIDDQLHFYFAKILNDNADKKIYDLIRKRALLQVENIKKGGFDKEIKSITEQILLHVKPKKFVGEDSFEAYYDKQFEKTNFILSQRLNGADVRTFTVLQYYNALELIQEQDRETKKSLQKKR